MDHRLYHRHLLSPELVTHPTTGKLLPWPLATAESLAGRARVIDAQHYPRQALAERFADYNRAIANDEIALANCRMLADDRAIAIITGQQAGLLSGPLYTIYKAATAIRLACAASTQLGRPVVPIFWNATEDHDLSEIATFHYPGHRWRANFPTAGLAAEALHTEPAVTDLLDAFLPTIPELAHPEAIRDLTAPTQRDYGSYSSAVIARLFGGTGLVVMEPRLLRPLAGDFFQRAIDQRAGIHDDLAAGAAGMAELGLAPAFTPDRGFGLFDIEPNGVRCQILERDNRFLVRGQWIERPALEALVAEHPEAISTGAYLRPILQTHLLPTLAYIAGPGEYAYHLQLRQLFDRFETPMPILHPRNHATLLTARERKIALQLGLTDDDIFGGPEPHYWQRDLPASDQAAFARAEAQLNSLFSELDVALQTPIQGRRHATWQERWQRDLQTLRRKVQRDYLQAAGIDNARVDRFFAVVQPGGQLQERLLNVFYFIQAQGPRLIQQLVETFDPFERRHYLITTDD